MQGIRFQKRRQIFTIRRIAWTASFLLALNAIGIAGNDDVRRESVPIRFDTMEKRDVAGRLIRFTLDAGLAVEAVEGGASNVGIADLVRIQISRPHQIADSKSPMAVFLNNGDVLPSLIVGGDGRSVELRHAEFGSFTIPLDSIRAIDTSPRTASRRKVGMSDGSDRRKGDMAYLLNGDLLGCVVMKIDETGVSVLTDAGDRMTIGFEVLARLDLAPGLSAGPIAADERKPHAARVWVDDSSRLTLQSLEWTAEEAVGRLKVGEGRIAIPSGRLSVVEIVGSDYEWLSDLDPADVVSEGGWGRDWAVMRDSNVFGDPMRIAGRIYWRGLGVHSRSRLEYRLDDRYAQFRCVAALDGAAGELADVDVRVLVDGQEKFSSIGVTGNLPPMEIEANLSGAKRLVLEVDYGKHGDIQDRFNWAAPILIRRQMAEPPKTRMGGADG